LELSKLNVEIMMKHEQPQRQGESDEATGAVDDTVKETKDTDEDNIFSSLPRRVYSPPRNQRVRREENYNGGEQTGLLSASGKPAAVAPNPKSKRKPLSKLSQMLEQRKPLSKWGQKPEEISSAGPKRPITVPAPSELWHALNEVAGELLTCFN
jgi:hypothetical protein